MFSSFYYELIDSRNLKLIRFLLPRDNLHEAYDLNSHSRIEMITIRRNEEIIQPMSYMLIVKLR